MARNEPTPDECALCGADIPPRARACPECGADERTGWREQSIYDGLDLPEPDDTPASRRSGQLPWYWVVTIVTVLLLLVLGALGLR
jgi:hypothetical protein